MGKKSAKNKKSKPARGRGAPTPAGRQRTRWVVACVIPLLLVGFSLYTYGLTGKAWNAVVKYQSPYLFDLEPQPASSRPATEGVLLIIVDGLRLDNSKKLDTWNAIRTGTGGLPAGADLSAVVGQPSLSNPAAAVIPSGTSQEIHGVTTNWYEGLLKVDHLFASAARSGKSTAVVAGKGWVELYGDSIDRVYAFDDSADDYDQKVFEQALAILQEKQLPDLMVVHFGGVDHASHEHGGASAEALETARTIDGYIRQLLDAYDLTRRTAILTADHGHIDTGGHGGWEPEVLNVPLLLVGRGVVPGTRGPALQVDIAPTIAALLGMSPPSHSIGTILDDVVSLPPEDLAKAFISLGRARQAFTEAYLGYVTADLPDSQALAELRTNANDGSSLLDQAWVNLIAGDPTLAAQTAKGALYLLDEARAKAKDLRTEKECTGRLPLVLALVVVPLIPLFYLGRNRHFVLSLAAAAVYFIGHALLFFVIRGFRFSLSIFNEESMIMNFFTARMVDAALVLVVAALLLGLALGWRKKYDAAEVAEAGASYAYLVAFGLGLQLTLFYYLFGVSFDWFIPNLVWGFKFYADCLQVVPVGFASLLVVPVVLAGAKLASLAGHPPHKTQKATKTASR